MDTTRDNRLDHISLWRWQSAIAVVLLSMAATLGASVSVASASQHWSEARCTATYGAWRKHHRHASALQSVSVRRALNRHHGCRLPLPRSAAPLALAPSTPVPAPAPPPPAPKPISPAKPAPAPAPVATPLTVANVCGFNPGLGQRYEESAAQDLQEGGPAWPVSYWLKSNGEIAFLAAATDGGTAVTIAVVPVPGSEGAIEFIAQCNWSKWLTVPEFQQQLEQADLTTYEPDSQSWWQELAPSMEALNGLALEDYTPTVGISVCNFDTSEECDYELDD
jgi:hypothetical protein